MDEESQNNRPKDLTGIFELPQADPPPSSHPLMVNDFPVPERVDAFESIDQLGMMDHPQDEKPAMPAESEPTEEAHSDPFASVTLPTNDPLENVKEYSEMTRGPIEHIPIHHPFHLLITGSFGPFERDKLLLFITENPIGIVSSDLDLQLKSGRVLLPRISEYAGIRLIQELRDSGLQFSLKPSKRDANELIAPSNPIELHFNGIEPDVPLTISIPILEPDSLTLSEYEEIDVVQGHQFIKAEMIEVERSDLFQEIIDHMTNGLKQKARLKGGHALTRLDQKIVPLRLPSQYQVSVKATVLRSKA